MASPTLVVFDLATGEVLWQRCAPGRSFGGLAAEAGGVIVDWAGGDGTPASPARSTGSDMASGATLWQFEAESYPGGFGGDTLYVSGSPDGSEPSPVVAIDAASGQERWRRDDVSGGGWFGLNGMASTYAVWAAVDGSIVALDSRTGAERWRTTGVQPVAAREDVVVMESVTGSPAVVALSADTGVELWRRPSGGIATVTDDELVVWPLEPKRNGQPATTTFVTIPVGGTAPPLTPPAEFTTTMEVWSLTDGTFLREFDVPGESGFLRVPSMMQPQGRLDDIAVIQDDNGTAVVDLATGGIVWSTPTSSSFLGTDDRAIVTSDGGDGITVLDARTGVERWTVHVPCLGPTDPNCAGSAETFRTVSVGETVLILALGNAAE